MSDSVGKISLDLEIQSDISKQISNVSSMIGRNLKKSLDSGMKGALDNMGNVAKKSVGNVTNAINNSLKSSIGKIKNTMSTAFNSMKSFKLPTFNFPKPTNVAPPKVADVSSAISNRGPPVDMSVTSAQIENVGRSLDNTNARIEQQKVKLAQLKEEYITCFNQGRKNALEEKILKTEASIIKLIGTSDKLGFKLNELDSKFAMASRGANSASTSSSKLKNALNGINNATNKASNGLKNLGSSTKNASNSISGSLKKIYKYAMAFMGYSIGIRAIRELGKSLREPLLTNQEFSNSLNQVKTNLMVAFTPILQAILPALNVLMSALAKATTYIASFISAIFGKTYKQSYQATQQLIDAKVAMGAYGDSAKKAAKDVKGLAAIDEINTLGATNDNIEGGVNDKIPQLVAPPIDTSAVDSSMKLLANKVKAVFATIFQPFKNAWDTAGAGVMTQFNAAIEGSKATMKNFFDMLASPPVQSFLEAIGKLALKLVELGLFIYNNYILPLINWFIEMTGPILSSLQPVIDAITNGLDWLMGEGKPVLDVIVTVLLSMAAAFLIVTAAVKVFNLVTGLISLITSPIGIAVIAIGAIIAIGVLLYKHWDEIKAKAIEVWDAIKEKFNQFKEWLGSVFATDWSQKFGFFGEILNGFLANVKNIGDSIKRVFDGIIDFVAGVFTGNWSRAWQGVKDIFGGIMDGLGAVIKMPLNAVIALINGAIGGINKIGIDIPDWVPKWAGGGKSFAPNIGKIPYLAKGGIVDNPTLAMVGEAGKEAVVPLENNTQGLDLLASKLLGRMGGTNTTNGDNDRPIQITLKLGELEFARVLIDSINKMTRMNNGECLINI